MPDTTDKKSPMPIGAVRDPKTGALLTMATAASNARADVVPVAPKTGFTLPSWVSTLLGILTAIAAVPALIVAGLASGGIAIPAFLTVAAGIGSGLAPLLGAFAFWAAGGDPLTALRKQGFAVPVLPASSSTSDGASPAPRVGPPEP